MKLTVESLNDGNAKIILNWNGKDYSETWTGTEKGSTTVEKSGIFEQMQKDGIKVNDTPIGDFLDNIEMSDFISVANIEKEYDNSDKEMDCWVCNLGKEKACPDCCRDWDSEEED